MTLVKDKRTGVYKAKYRTSEGKVKSISTKSTDLTTAKKVVKDSKLDELETAAKAGRITNDVVARIVTGSKVNITTAAEQFAEWMVNIGRSANTINTYKTVLRAWANQVKIANLAPIAITEQHISDYVNDDSPVKYSHRVLKLAAISAFFQYCAAKGWTTGNVARLVKVQAKNLSHAQKEKRQRQSFTDAEIKKLIDLTSDSKLPWDQFWRVAVVIARHTGLRLGDICNLEWECFRKVGKIIVWTDKRDARVELDMSDELFEAIGMVMPEDNQYLFPKQRDLINNPALRSSLSIFFSRLCKRAGVVGKTFHDLRSTFIEDALKRGISMPHISKMVGHSNESTTRGYVPNWKGES